VFQTFVIVQKYQKSNWFICILECGLLMMVLESINFDHAINNVLYSNNCSICVSGFQIWLVSRNQTVYPAVEDWKCSSWDEGGRGWLIKVQYIESQAVRGLGNTAPSNHDVFKYKFNTSTSMKSYFEMVRWLLVSVCVHVCLCVCVCMHVCAWVFVYECVCICEAKHSSKVI